MEPPTIVIGSNSRYAKKADEPNGKPGANQKRRVKDTRPRASGSVEVFLGKVLIQKVPFSQLVRFSRTAQAAFPRPGAASTASAGDKIGRPSSSTAVAPAASGSATASQENAVRTLQLHCDEMWEQPSKEAFLAVFQWMHEAVLASSRAQALPVFGCSGSADESLVDMVDHYAAAVCLDLRPAPQQLRQDINTRLSTSPPTVEEVGLIHARLPIRHGITTRMINSFLENRSVARGWYSKEERDDIEEYFYTIDEELFNRFRELEGHHKRVRRVQQREKGAATGQPRGGGAVGGKARSTPSVAPVVATTSTAATKTTAAASEASRPAPAPTAQATGGNTAAGPSKRGRRGGRKGLDRRGNPVPGANYD